MSSIDYSRIPKQSAVDLCALALLHAAEALKTPEGRQAIEKGKQENLRRMAERNQ